MRDPNLITKLNKGLALLDFRAGVSNDPFSVFASWNPSDHDPCSWSNVRCVDGNVHVLDLNELSLEGVLAPGIGNLTHLRCLVLSQNKFSGVIPKELGELTMLEVLDLRDNNFSGHIPSELGRMPSLKRLLLCNNNLEGSIPMELRTPNFLYEMQYDENLLSLVANGVGCLNRKFGRCVWQGGSKLQKKADSLLIQIKEIVISYLNPFQLFRIHRSSSINCSINEKCELEAETVENVVRRKLAEESSNLAAAPSPRDGIGPPKIIALPTTRSSGSFPAVPKNPPPPLPPPPVSPPPPPPLSPDIPQPSSNETLPPANLTPQSGSSSSDKWKVWVIISFCILLLIIIAMVLWCVCRSRAVKTIGPWRTGISGQLQKAFITGVPKLNRTELETACEDFSNIIETSEGYTLYKGTLSSGVEICVAATSIASLKDWSKRAELGFLKKIDALSRVNHKNFVNLLGYCEEDEPFVRMMVFEYAANGLLSEHLHVKELEHLDWSSRMRIIMGTAYCLEYMHELNPPVPHTNLTSRTICLTDDYAPKVAEMGFWNDLVSKAKLSADSESEHSALPPLIDTETNVYSFGILMLEIISGKLPYSEQQEPLVAWAAQYLNDKRNTSDMIDPTLEFFKQHELDFICEVIEECIQQDARKRPTMKEVVTKLKEVLKISPDQAIPRLSPLWWAELEILSGETT
ncbi:protein MALE DISCOVERER 2 isoform X5 [Helianthus annuus]|uniref:protein MALE DISCOVERER 2 isoform X5 n=1 Tax=Helianthus annuus TaxID=4232 RepID=UPI000B907D8A|nr:protein MALE DISCOVERER 2 isoform X5 [Helianthus annuus]XP_022028204.1 protein MALE DISCOVERER 2 isoform X5 [Helianthus annuus]